MNFGFNSNIRVGDAMYHAQTEDRGPSHPFLDTVVYMAGRVVYKRSTSYEIFARGMDPETLAQKLHERLSRQHRDVIADLEGGILPFQSKEKSQPAAEKAETLNSLDLRLMNPKAWLVAGNMVLEIELSEKNSKRPIGDADVEACLEHETRRALCAEGRTDVKGCATLKLPVPSDVAEGSALVVRATDGSRYGELRIQMKSKASDKTPAPASR